VYLPGGCDWYDFWTGRRHAGGRRVEAAAPLETVPLFVRAGSILPLGPVMQYTDERPDAPWELRIYPGADGRFDLYEDAGDGLEYQSGQFAATPLTWDDARSELCIGRREGGFASLIRRRGLRVIRVAEDQGAGIEPLVGSGPQLDYDGSPLTAAVK
jgi:alpha-D-xyloside xylohydrolase